MILNMNSFFLFIVFYVIFSLIQDKKNYIKFMLEMNIINYVGNNNSDSTRFLAKLFGHLQ